MKRLLWVGLVTAFISANSFAADNFMTVADIHFDPTASCAKAGQPCPILRKLINASPEEWEAIFEKYGDKEPSGYQHDTNYALFKQTLTELKVVNQKDHPKFVLLLGDFIWHNSRDAYRLYSGDKSNQGYRSFILKTMQFMTLEFRKALPNVDMYPVIGNNDSYTGDYQIVPNGKFLQDITATWAPLILNEHNRELFKQTFTYGGYYVIELSKRPEQRIIVLNTVLFSTNSTSAVAQAAAHQELKWLYGELSQAAKTHQKVLLAFHIPVGIDVYATIKNVFSSILEFWQPAYSLEFQNYLNKYPETVTGILPAHIHVDGFQWLMFNGLKEIPVSLTPSISPIFGNDPAFKVYSYDPTNLHLKTFDVYSYPINKTGDERAWTHDQKNI